MVGSRPTGQLGLGNLALGTAPLGGLYDTVTDAQATGTLECALSVGITHFDTAPHYGRGLAESRVGQFLRTLENPESVTVSTKVGRRVRELDIRPADDIFFGAPPGESVFDFSPEGILDELNESRIRLGRDHIDVALLHDPNDHLDEALAAAEVLIRQRDSGRVGAIGVGTNSASVAQHLMDRIDIDVVLLAGRITLLESSGESVAQHCADSGVALLAAGVFQSGILTGATDTYDYLPAPPHIRERVAQLQEVCQGHHVRLHQVAINHPRRIAGVSTTVVGARSPAEVNAAADAFASVLPDALWAEIDELRSTFTDPTEES